MKIVLTGGIACGKSLLSRYLKARGVTILDADDVVHELLPDPAERRRIAAEVFADPVKRKELEARLHPLVRERLMRGLQAADGLVIAVVPLLYEVGWDSDFDCVVCIASSREQQLKRMMERRGYTREEAEARLKAQLPVEEKASRADYVILNDGTTEDLEQEAITFLEWLKRKDHG